MIRILPNPSRKRQLQMVMLFLDESGHFSDSDYLCIAGYIATDAGWESFCKEWKILLNKHGLSTLHLKEIMSRSGNSPASSWPPEQKDSMLREFIGVIRKHVEVGFAVAIDAKHYRGVADRLEKKCQAQGLKNRSFSAHTFAFSRIIRKLMDYLKESAELERASIIVDDAEQYSMKCYSFFSKLKKVRPEVKSQIVSISFADDTYFFPLQAADLLAYATLHEFRKGEKAWAEEATFSDLLKAHDPAFGLIYRSEFWGSENEDALKLSILEDVTGIDMATLLAEENNENN